jgi:hypothetical protein
LTGQHPAGLANVPFDRAVKKVFATAKTLRAIPALKNQKKHL